MKKKHRLAIALKITFLISLSLAININLEEINVVRGGVSQSIQSQSPSSGKSRVLDQNRKLKISVMGDSLTSGLCQATSQPQTLEQNPPPWTNWVNYFTEYIVQNFGTDKFEVNNYAMSSRALAHDGGWNHKPIWTGEKFNDFMSSNADVFIIMIGQNDNQVKKNGTWTAQWNNETAVNNFIDSYEELANKIWAMPQRPTIFVISPPPTAQACVSLITVGDTQFYNMSTSLAGTIAEKPGCETKKNITIQAMPSVYKKVKEGMGLDDLHLIDGFNLFGGLNAINKTHDQYYCDGVHLNTAGSALLGLEVYTTLRKANIIPTNYKQLSV